MTGQFRVRDQLIMINLKKNQCTFFFSSSFFLFIWFDEKKLEKKKRCTEFFQHNSHFYFLNFSHQIKSGDLLFSLVHLSLQWGNWSASHSPGPSYCISIRYFYCNYWGWKSLVSLFHRKLLSNHPPLIQWHVQIK